MNLENNYMSMLMERIEQTFQCWEIIGEISKKDIYSFLDDTSSTASALELTEVSNIAGEIIAHLDIEDRRLWKAEEWNDLLTPFTSIITNKYAKQTEKVASSLDNSLKEVATTIEPQVPDHSRKVSDVSDAEGSQESNKNRATDDTDKQEILKDCKLQVIVVDDDPLIRTVLERGFSDWHIKDSVATNVKTFSDGYSLLQSNWYSPDDYYVVLIDGVMPQMDGTELLIELRNQYPEDKVLIVMLSSRDDERSIIHALEQGADDYFLKPFYLEEVVARINRLVRRVFFKQ